MKEETFGKQVELLGGILKNIKNALPEDGKETAANLHEFGSCNMATEQSKALESIKLLREKYQSFLSLNNKTAVAVKLLLEKQAISKVAVPLKNTLHDAISKIMENTKGASAKVVLYKLEVIATDEGLSCDISGNDCFISSGMFYVEVKLKENGDAENVNIHFHTGELKAYPHLVDSLRQRNFEKFRSHLHSLKKRYCLTGDSAIKSKILASLSVLEEDLVKFSNNESYESDAERIMKGAIGVVTPVYGGKSLELAYCTDPLSTIDASNQISKDASTYETRYKVSLCAESSSTNNLPVSTTLSFEADRFTSESEWKTEQLPAAFVLNFENPLPTSVHVAKLLHNLLRNDDKFFHMTNSCLDKLILNQATGVTEDVTYTHDLPDVTSTFRWKPNKNNRGLLISSIPFTKPSQLPKIIKILRFQAIYNILLSSFVKEVPDTRKDKDVPLISVFASEWNLITTNFKLCVDSSVASIDFFLALDGSVECSLNVLPGSPVVCTNQYLNKIANKCLSIPILMRSLVKKALIYKPENLAVKKQQINEKRFQRPKKLQMPSLTLIQSGLISPHVNSPSNFLNFSAGISPHTPLFPFDGGPMMAASAVSSPPKPSRKRTLSSSAGTPGTLSTPGSEGSRTPGGKHKLPKITLKRKRENSEIYEIDQTKSVMEPEVAATSSLGGRNKPMEDFVYPPQFTDGNTKRAPPQQQQPVGLFGEPVNFPDLPIETDIEGLFGIPTEPFVQEDTGSLHIERFDLDVMTTSGNTNFEQLNVMPANAIDPSTLVGGSNFPMENVMDDIANIINTDQ